MKVVWLSRARIERHSQLKYIAIRNPQAAVDMGDRLIAAIRTLNDFPEAGRAGRSPRTRELVVAGTPFIAIYRIVNGNEVHVLRILHSSQKWPSE